jgi:fluoride exporter
VDTGILIVGLGSALGGMARFWISGAVSERAASVFPWGTLTVNVAGSFLIGLIAVLTSPEGRFMVAGSVREFAMLGFLGGFTTFSSFSLNTLNLVSDGEWFYAGLNVLASVVSCLVAVWAGTVCGQFLNQ